MVTTVAPELPRGQAQQHVMGGGAVSSESEAEGSRELRSGRRPSGPAPFLFDKRRRTTAGPLLLGGAVRVLQPKQASDEEAGGEDDVMVEAGGEDGMQAIIRAGAGNAGPTTLHNPLFRA